jgi:nucleotide-binding universal stress UspA family protein
MYKRLLVPVDGTEISERTMSMSLALASQLGAAVTGFVVEAQPPLPTASGGLSNYSKDVSEHQARTAAHANKVLAHFGEMAAAAAVPFESHYDRDDDIAGAIARAAQDKGCDMIVMATHGRGTFGELLFGSQTKNVMARCKLPLLVLH